MGLFVEMVKLHGMTRRQWTITDRQSSAGRKQPGNKDPFILPGTRTSSFNRGLVFLFWEPGNSTGDLLLLLLLLLLGFRSLLFMRRGSEPYKKRGDK
jgi:hypothetical protein